MRPPASAPLPFFPRLSSFATHERAHLRGLASTSSAHVLGTPSPHHHLHVPHPHSLPASDRDRERDREREREGEREGWLVGWSRWVSFGWFPGSPWGSKGDSIRVRKGIRWESSLFGDGGSILVPARHHPSEERGGGGAGRDPQRTRGGWRGILCDACGGIRWDREGVWSTTSQAYELEEDDGRGAARAATIAHVHVHVRRRSERSEGG